MLVHLHLVDDVGSHLQTVLQLVEGREEHFLDNLEIAEIAYWQVVHDEHYLLWKALELVALGANQLEYVWILLVWHDARTGGALLRQLHETEVLAVEHAGIESHLCQCSCHGSHGESHVALHLSSAHLCINHIIVHAVETEKFGGHGAVQRE